MDPKSSSKVLFDFNDRFLGYGCLNSKVWLIGPQAGGGNSIEEIYRRALVWSKRGGKETEDLHEFHTAIKIDWTRKIQPTWGPLIRVILVAVYGKNGEVNVEEVRQFQKSELGRGDGSTGVFDLNALPAPSLADWTTGKFGFDGLKSAEEWEARFALRRCHLFQEKLARHKPRLVLFYGRDHESWWQTISAQPFSASRLNLVSLGRDENTLFALIPHPINLNRQLPTKGKGVVKSYLAETGAILREALR